MFDMHKVLVIDDDKDILEAIELMLLTDGYDTAVMPKCDRVFEKVRAYKPDLIILDVLLSGKDGRTICRSLKQDTETRHIPVIMTSAHPSAKETISESGADSFVAKPFSINQLMGEVIRLID